jgi:hypothetical protein
MPSVRVRRRPRAGLANNPLHGSRLPWCDVAMTTTTNMARPAIASARTCVVGGTSLPFVPAPAASRGDRLS